MDRHEKIRDITCDSAKAFWKEIFLAAVNKIALSVLELVVPPMQVGRSREEKGNATVATAPRPAAPGRAASREGT